jgi:hypothetical protein
MVGEGLKRVVEEPGGLCPPARNVGDWPISGFDEGFPRQRSPEP